MESFISLGPIDGVISLVLADATPFRPDVIYYFLRSRGRRCAFVPQIYHTADLSFHFLHADTIVPLSHGRPKSHRPRPRPRLSA
jgi:hypothetical protein